MLKTDNAIERLVIAPERYEASFQAWPILCGRQKLKRRPAMEKQERGL
jgi:hypothetical protein